MAHIDTRQTRISWLEFNQIYGPMVVFFRAKTNETIDRLYHKKVYYYPVDCLKEAVSTYMDSCKPMPSNLPSPAELSNLCARWLDANTDVKESITIYDPDEDSDFPISFLNEGLNILEKNGMKAFVRYCEYRKVPKQDRNRLVFRLNVIKGREANPQKQLNKILGAIGSDDDTESDVPIYINLSYKPDNPMSKNVVYVPEPFKENKFRAQRDDNYRQSLMNAHNHIEKGG